MKSSENRDRPTFLAIPGLLEIFQTILGLLNDLLKDADPIPRRSIAQGPKAHKEFSTALGDLSFVLESKLWA